MINEDSIQRLRKYREEWVLFFRRATLNVVLESEHRTASILAVNLAKAGKVFLYTSYPTSLSLVELLFSLAGQNLNVFLPYFSRDVMSSLLSALSRESSPSFVLIEDDDIDMKIMPEMYEILLKGHTVVFFLPKEAGKDRVLKIFDDTITYNTLDDLYVFESGYGRFSFYLLEDWTLEPVVEEVEEVREEA